MIPKTKAELLGAMELEHRLLWEAVARVDARRRELPGACGAWSVKDVLAHLVAWKRMLLGWYGAGRRGEAVRTPAEDLNWRETPELNRRIYEAWRERSWEDVVVAFDEAWRELLALAREMPEEELFRKGLYGWMRGWPMGRWIAANTSSHYRWARVRVRRMG